MVGGAAFDVEGTIVNVEPAHMGGWVKAADEFGIKISIEEAIEKLPHFIGGPDKAIVDEIFALNPTITPPAFEEFMKQKWHYYDELLKTVDFSPRPGFLGILENLRRQGMKTCWGTAVEMNRATVILERSGLTKLFSSAFIVMLKDVKNPKPAPDCFLETARRMEIDPREQVVFEDSPRGVESGVRAGSIVIGMPVYDTPITKQRLFRAGAIAVFSDWRQLNIDELLYFAHLESISKPGR